MQRTSLNAVRYTDTGVVTLRPRDTSELDDFADEVEAGDLSEC